MIRWALLLAMLLGPAAHADDQGEREARALFREGNRLIEQGDYVGALDLYQTAFERWPNPKILLNMGTALRQLGRDAEAAETYERYLGSPEADPEKQIEVEKVLADLVAKLARLRIEVNEPGARIQVDGKSLAVATRSMTVRLEPGTHSVVAEKEGYVPAVATVTVAAGQERSVGLTLARKEPAPQSLPVVGVSPPATSRSVASQPAPVSVAREVERTPPDDGMHGLGAMLRADVDEKGRGAVAVIAATYGMATWADVLLGAIVGPNQGFYAGVNVFLLPDMWKPLLTLGMPVFVVDGARPGIHVATGLQWDPSRLWGFLIEAGIHYYPSVPAGFDDFFFVPSVAVQGRL